MWNSRDFCTSYKLFLRGSEIIFQCRGGDNEPEGVVLVEAVNLRPDENVRLNPSRLTELFVQLGNRGAEDVVCRAMEELAVRLADIEAAYWQGDFSKVSKGSRGLIAIADQIGLNGLAQVARHVASTAARSDHTAISATVSRLMRIGNKSLSAVWDAQDMTL